MRTATIEDLAADDHYVSEARAALAKRGATSVDAKTAPRRVVAACASPTLIVRGSRHPRQLTKLQLAQYREWVNEGCPGAVLGWPSHDLRVARLGELCVVVYDRASDGVFAWPRRREDAQDDRDYESPLYHAALDTLFHAELAAHGGQG